MTFQSLRLDRLFLSSFLVALSCVWALPGGCGPAWLAAGPGWLAGCLLRPGLGLAGATRQRWPAGWLGPKIPLGYWQARPVCSGFPHPPSPQAAQLRRPEKKRTPPHLHRGDTNKRQTITKATRNTTDNSAGKACGDSCCCTPPEGAFSSRRQR